MIWFFSRENKSPAMRWLGFLSLSNLSIEFPNRSGGWLILSGKRNGGLDSGYMVFYSVTDTLLFHQLKGMMASVVPYDIQNIWTGYH